MSAGLAERPDTVMGRALAQRAVDLARLQELTRTAAGDSPFDLTRPVSAPLPKHVLQAAKDALDRGETHYTSRPGVPELRHAIAVRSTEHGFPAVADSTVVTNGGAEAIYIALQAVLSPQKTAVVVEPVDPHVVEMIRFIGAKIERVSSSVDDRFIPTVEDVAQSSANVLVLAAPSLISGVMIPQDVLANIIGTAIDRGMNVVLDRSLAPCLFDPDSARFSDADLGAKVITVGSFSAGFGLHGWRVGYFTAPSDLVGKLRGLKQAMSICTTAVSQYAALAALTGPTDWLDQRRRTFAAKLDSVVTGLTGSPFSVVQPDAYPSLLIDLRQLGQNDLEIVDRIARQAGITLEPGSRFGQATRGFARIDLGVEEVVLHDAVGRLAGMNVRGVSE